MVSNLFVIINGKNAENQKCRDKGMLLMQRFMVFSEPI